MKRDSKLEWIYNVRAVYPLPNYIQQEVEQNTLKKGFEKYIGCRGKTSFNNIVMAILCRVEITVRNAATEMGKDHGVAFTHQGHGACDYCNEFTEIICIG